ncbi:HD-GYP domain-containing protein [Paracidovorax sp. MALMAid1276]|uniref:HD-GYP domain-containing protein n=1 Tax=Paracidovorax sp. MALMAid1276 TaxID=3411631 RepID=UPI003B9C6A4E
MSAAHPHPSSHRPEGEYEDLLSLWSDLEAALSVLLSRPLLVQDFPGKVRQFDGWLQDLVAHDIDSALYLMFQLASTSTVGYSASHALVCGTLCHIMAHELHLPQRERDSLVRAALTMNIGMTRLQDELAEQRERPSAAQQDAIRSHPEDSMLLLQRLFIADELWLDVVGQHHATVPDREPLAQQEPQDRLTRILGTIDRYAAMISPRKSRAGRSATDSVRAIVGQEIDQRDEVSYTLVRSVGLCPPGTFVKLDNGETAVVLRRSDKANHPLVASVLDSDGTHRTQPNLYQTASGKPRIQSALARSAVGLELDHRTMVRLGLYAAQHSARLRGLVTGPGAL